MSSPSSAPPTEPQIRVTDHALARARERHIDLRLLGERQLLRLICREVGDAMRNERVAKNAPREVLVHPAYSRRQKASWARYAWDEKHQHVYVIRRVNGLVLVVTVLATTRSRAA